MITLKIGQNHMLIDNRLSNSVESEIIYAMSCFKKKGKIIIPAGAVDSFHYFLGEPLNYKREIDRLNINEAYLFINDNKLSESFGRDYNLVKKECARVIERNFPDIKITIIDIKKKINSKEYKLGESIFRVYKQDPVNLLSHLTELGNYKTSKLREKEIEEQLKVLDSQLKKLNSKEEDNVEYLDEKGYNCLKLLDKAEITPNGLLLTIKPLNIYPSENFSNCVPESEFIRNPYIYKVEKALRSGGHFKMPGTQVLIPSDFKPKFIRTMDDKYDTFLNVNNYFHVGYVHFGVNGICAGEFNDTIGNARTYGIEYYLLSFKQYITTGNVRDVAGIRLWRYPIFDDEGHIMYWVILDLMKKGIQEGNINVLISEEERRSIEDMTWDEFFNFLNAKNIKLERTSGIPELRLCNNDGTDYFIRVCEHQDPDLYKVLTEGAN